MCSISASKSKEVLLKLVELNRYRGEKSHSVSQFLYHEDLDPDANGFYLKQQIKSYGPLDVKQLDGEWDYCIVHQQAPTSKEVNNTELAIGKFIHPAKKDKSYLWHNGIIKEGKFEGDWDTEWVLDQALDDLEKGLQRESWPKMYTEFNAKLSEVDGTFACMMHHDSSMFIFRNEISPLFSEGSSFSSTKFENSTPVPANIMWELVLKDEEDILVEQWKFKTKENPYHFGE